MFKPIRSCIFAGALACALTGTVLAAGPLKPVDNPAPIAAKGIEQTQALNAVKNAAQLRKFRVVSTHGNVVKLAYPSGPRAQKFEAQFDVVYEGSKIAVKYASSRGLDAGPCQNDAKQICLHRNVNKWMANLASDITKELGRAH